MDLLYNSIISYLPLKIKYNSFQKIISSFYPPEFSLIINSDIFIDIRSQKIKLNENQEE